VTDEESMAAGVRAVEEAEGAIGVLVNNAGYSQSGTIETLTADQIRRQYETNVFGLIRMSQLVLPGMRRQGFGRIGGDGGPYAHFKRAVAKATADVYEGGPVALLEETRLCGCGRGERRSPRTSRRRATGSLPRRTC
jgi:NADP-dependent 3-hydroxy acid dehydrogenase YdfG